MEEETLESSAEISDSPEADTRDARSDVEAAFEEVEASEGETAEQKAERARDKLGRFAQEKKVKKASSEQDFESTAQTAAPANVTENGTIAVSGAPQQATIAAPQSFSAEERQLFTELQPRAQQILTRLESASTRGHYQKAQELAKAARSVEGVLNAVSPFVEEYQREGRDIGQTTAAMMAWHRHLVKDPVKGALDFLRDVAGVGIEDVIQFHNTQIQNGRFPEDPRVKQLEEQLQTFQQRLEQQDQERAQAQAMQFNTTIDRFASEVGSDGQYLRPYFQHVRTEMVPFVDYLQRQNPGLSDSEALAAAYERAILVNPQLRAMEEKRQNELRQLQTIESAKAKTQLAKRGGSSLNGAPGRGQATSKNGSVLEAVTAAFDKYQA